MALDNIIERLNAEGISRRDVLKAGLAAGIGAAGIGIAGCTSPSTSPVVSPSTTPLPTKSVVKIGYLPSDHDAPLFIAKTKGFLDKYGVNVELTKFESGGMIMQQIAGGTIDMGVAGVPPVIIAADKDPSIKMVASVHNNGSGIIVKKGSGIAKAADLKGKKIGIPGPSSIQNILLKKVLADNGIDYAKDVTVSTVPAAQILGSLESGTIDAYSAWEPFITLAVNRNIGEVLLRSEDIMPGHPCDSIVTTAGMIKDYPGSVVGFLKAHRDATEFIKTNFDEAATIVGSKDWLDSGADTEKVAMTHMTFMFKPDEGYFAGSEAFATMLKDMGLVTKSHDRNDLFDLSLINTL